MGSKSVLILGIVFIFLLNVLAVHNYIDNYYYQPEEIIANKPNKSITDFFEDNILSNDKNNSKSKPLKIEKVSDTSVITDKKQKIDKSLVEYKNDSYNQISYKKSKREEKEKKDAKKEKEKDDIDKNKKNIKNNVAEKGVIANKEVLDESEKNAYITLDLNINNPFQEGNPIIKKIVNNLDNKKVIKIKIYKYSIKIKDYLESIKNELVDYGIDIDDIKVIYKKDETKKDKIKILLTKKD
jgi:hypothetical protein